jgi:Na+/H+ antiporter NhaD/arsenite permease-like protein
MKTKILVLYLLSMLVGVAGYLLVRFTLIQSVIIAIFALSILGTLFFWEFRLSFVFIGSGVLLLIHAVDLPNFMEFASLDVILFLIGMMIIVAMMKEAGFFFWIITIILRKERLTGPKLFVLLMIISALLSGLMGEVSSMIVMATVIFAITGFLEMSSVPLIISSVLATNVGSASTLLGNPIGILIAVRGKLSFEDFLVRALPLSVLVLAATIIALLVWYRTYIREMSSKLKVHTENKGFLYLISVPPDFKTKVSMVIFVITILLIGLHKRLALLLNVEEHAVLMVLPLVSAGLVMLYRHDKARHFVEQEIEWNSLLFFIFLFAQAGVIRSSGVADVIAKRIVEALGTQSNLLSGVVLFSSGILSSILDNLVVVSSYIPVVKGLEPLHVNLKPLWWAMLFGACYGGNITMIGSTANIVALGLLEKKHNIKVNFFDWLKIGLVVGILGMVIAYFGIVLLPIYDV